MKAIIFVTYKDDTIDKFEEGDFWSHQFKFDLDDRNTEYLKVGGDYIKKSEIRSIKIQIKKEEEAK